MGFIVSDNSLECGKYHRLIKQTPEHMIIVTYRLRSRLIMDPTNMADEYKEEAKRYEPESFFEFLKKQGMVPPDLMGMNEQTERKEYMEKLKSPWEHLIDDEEDKTYFEVAVLNRANQALVADCRLYMSEIFFHKFMVIPENAKDWL